jgi:peptidase E
MKLLLTSQGFEKNPKIGKRFLELVDKPVSKIKVIFVPTASDVEIYKSYIENDKKNLLELGIKEANIKTLLLDHKINYSEVKSYDVIHVCGGNTFYLLKKVRESGFDKIIKKFVKGGGVYMGISAGSYIVCPTIEAATWKHADRNIVGLKDLTALNLVPFIITAHYSTKFKVIIDKAEANTKYEVKRLTDMQALLVKNREIRLIE